MSIKIVEVETSNGMSIKIDSSFEIRIDDNCTGIFATKEALSEIAEAFAFLAACAEDEEES